MAHESATNFSAMKAALVKPGGEGNDLPPEPQSRATELPEWECGEAAEKTKMCGLINKGVWTQCPRSKGKVVLGTKRLYSRKIGERGEVVKHKCRFVAQGFRQIKGLHHEESSFPTPVAASIRMALATAVVMDMELRHIGFEQAYLLADESTTVRLEDPRKGGSSTVETGTAGQ